MSQDLNFLTVGEVQKILRLSRSAMYRLCKSGDLKSLRVGKAIRITRENLNNFINSGESK